MEDGAQLPQNHNTALISLEEKQAMLAAIISSTDDTIMSMTLEGTIISWNPAAERMFGYAELEAIGRQISLIIPPDRQGEETFITYKVSKGERVDHFETERLCRDGKVIPVSLTVSPVRAGDGRIIGASKIIRNLSGQKAAALKQSLLTAIIDSSDDAILSKKLDGTITSWNKAAEKMFGYTEAEALGQHISLIIPPDRYNEEDFIIGEVSKGHKVDHFQTLRLAKNGNLIPISLSVSPVVDEQGNVIGASKIARDISAEQNSQQEYGKLYEHLKELNARKDEFIGLASHELKTPLTSISGYLQILEMRIADETNKTFLLKAQQQLKKLSSLVDDLLDVSKIEAGKLHFAIEDFNICGVIEDAVELISHSNSDYKITVHSPIQEYTLKGDGHRIEQVVINLLTNAIRYAPGSRQIDVFVKQDNGKIEVGVRDYGVGIAAEKLAHIFSRYYRVEDTNSKASGLGIGLYLCHEIITRHNGKIWVESEPGKGSTFWFMLPS